MNEPKDRDLELVELIDEGLPDAKDGYWKGIDDSLRAIEGARVVTPTRLEPQDSGTARAPWLGTGPLLAAASLLLIVGLGFFFLRSEESATPVDVVSRPPTPVPVAPTQVPVPTSDVLGPTTEAVVTVVPDVTAVPEVAGPGVEITDTVGGDVARVPRSVAPPKDTEAGELLMTMFLAGGSTENAEPQIGDGSDPQAPIHELDPQLDRPDGTCSFVLQPLAYRAGLHHYDPVAAGAPETLLLAYHSPAAARGAYQLLWEQLLECPQSETSAYDVKGIDSVRVLFDDFALGGPEFNAIEVNGLVLDTNSRGPRVRTVHLVHDRFIGRVTVSTGGAAPEEELRAAADALAAMLLAGGVTPPEAIDRSVTTDRGESLAFSADPGWVALCLDVESLGVQNEDARVVQLSYAGREHLEVLRFRADVESGLYGSDSPAPAELERRASDATISFAVDGEAYEVVLPNPPSSFVRVHAQFDGPQSAAPSIVELFVLDSQGQPWGLDRIYGDEAGEFSSEDVGAVQFEGAPCLPGAETVTFSIDAVVPEEYSNRAEWIRVVTTEVTAEIINR